MKKKTPLGVFFCRYPPPFVEDRLFLLHPLPPVWPGGLFLGAKDRQAVKAPMI